MGKLVLKIQFDRKMSDPKLKKAFVDSVPKYKSHKHFYDKVYKKMLDSTFNARVKPVTTGYKFKRVGRYAENSNAASVVAFRTQFKVSEEAK